MKWTTEVKLDRQLFVVDHGRKYDTLSESQFWATVGTDETLELGLFSAKNQDPFLTIRVCDLPRSVPPKSPATSQLFTPETASQLLSEAKLFRSRHMQVFSVEAWAKDAASTRQDLFTLMPTWVSILVELPSFFSENQREKAPDHAITFTLTHLAYQGNRKMTGFAKFLGLLAEARGGRWELLETFHQLNIFVHPKSLRKIVRDFNPPLRPQVWMEILGFDNFNQEKKQLILAHTSMMTSYVKTARLLSMTERLLAFSSLQKWRRRH